MKLRWLFAVTMFVALNCAYGVDTGGVSRDRQDWDGVKVMIKDAVNAETLTGNATLYENSNKFQHLDPGGTARNVTLPAEEDNAGMWFWIINGADGDEDLVVKDDGGTTIATVGQNQAGLLTNSGTAWKGFVMGAAAGSWLVAAGTTAGATSQAQDFGSNGIEADVIAESTAATGVTIDGLLVKDTTSYPNAISANDASLGIDGKAGAGGGAGGAIALAGGGGHTNGNGGAVTAAGGAAAGTGTGGAASVTGGAAGAGATGTGGAASVTGGSGAAATDGTGGAAAVTGGAGKGAANGGAASLTGGVSGATSSGGAVTIAGGASAGAGGTAGAVAIDSGAATGGTGAAVTVGATNATDVTVGNASGTVTIAGSATAIDLTGGDASLGITGAAGAGGGNGGAVPIAGGVGHTNGNGGAASVAGGAAAGTGTGGAASLTGGAAGNGATGTGGAASVTGGAGTAATNAAGGAASLVGGVGKGTQAGGASAVTGGQGGATGAGGAVTVTSGAGGSTSGSSGALTVATGTTTAGSGSATGNVVVQSGAGAASAAAVAGGASGTVTLRSQAGGANTGGATGQVGGAGGAIAVTGGAGGATNSTGAHAGGAGAAISATAGAGGAASAGTGNGGAGGAIGLTCGAGGASAGGTNGAGGAFSVITGAPGGAGAAAGNVSIDCGAAGAGTAGTIAIGGTNAGTITLGRSGQTVNAPGTVTISNTGLQVYDAGSDHLLTIKTATDEAAAYNCTIPDLSASDTFAMLGVNNTHTGTNIFPNAGLKIQDGGGDHQLCFTTSTDEAASYNVIVPDLAGNDTLVTLATAQTLTGVKTLANATLLTMGTGSDVAKLVGVVNSDTTAVGNVDGGEDDLITYSLLANSLSGNGKGLQVTFFGTTAANANNKTLKIYFGASQILTTGAVGANDKDWKVTAIILRDGATSQICISEGRFNDTEVEPAFTDAAEDETGAITIKATGESAGAASNDIVCKAMLLKWVD